MTLQLPVHLPISVKLLRVGDSNNVCPFQIRLEETEEFKGIHACKQEPLESMHFNWYQF